MFGTPTTNPAGSIFCSTASAPGLFGSAATGTAASGGLFGSTTAGASTLGSSLLGAKTTASGGLFGTTATATPSLFGSATTSTTPSLFGSTTTATAMPSLFGNTTTTTASSSLFGNTSAFAAKSTAAVAPTLSLGTANTTGGLFGTTAATTTSAGLTITPFASTTANAASKGLGGVDPQKSSSSTGDGSVNWKSSDSKAMKETNVPQEISTIVEDFKKHIKSQKTVQEDIARVTHKPIFRVQDDVKQLRQLLAVVSNGLQRNAGCIEKLKQESALELKNVEIAQRTKDTPPGLQYENTAPMEYFQRLIEDFDLRMQQYRQQIETVEQHFLSLQQPSSMSPHELTTLLRKIHETFIAVAAQLQMVHEEVKTQKEHLLSYRKVFQGDSTDIFELRRRNKESTGNISSLRLGPTPFSGVSNAAAVAMASALNRSQQPSGAPPTLGLTQQNQTQFGGGFGFNTNQNNSAFGSQSALGTTAFGTSAVAPTVGVASPFNLQKPPLGNKRGKTK